MENNLPFQDFKDDTIAYLRTQYTLGRLHLIGGISRIFGTIMLTITLILLLSAVFTFCAVALVLTLATYIPAWAACLIIGGVYVLLIALVIIFRKQLFINPLVSKLSAIFFAEEGRQAEEQRLKKEALDD